MTFPKINATESFNKAKEAVVKGYNQKVKPMLDSGIKYTKNLAKDTVEFAKANPKKTGMIAAGAAFLTGIIALGVKLIKAISAKSEHIHHQREIIDALKDEVGFRDEMIGALHDSVEAAHNHFANLKAKQ